MPGKPQLVGYRPERLDKTGELKLTVLLNAGDPAVRRR
jgi:hypothetical protein